MTLLGFGTAQRLHFSSTSRSQSSPTPVPSNTVTPNRGSWEVSSDDEPEPNTIKSIPGSPILGSATMTVKAQVNKSDETSQNGRKRKYHEYFQCTSTVEIIVGSERKTWTLVEDLLCDRIAYFTAAFKSCFKEGESKKLEMPEDDPESFALLVEWVYTKSVECLKCDPSNYSSKMHIDPDHDLQWCALWVLADKLVCDDLAQFAIDQYKKCQSHSKVNISPETVQFVCEKTTEKSALRKMLVKQAADEFLIKDVPGFGKAPAINDEFNCEVMKEIRDHLKGGNYCYPTCIFHKGR